MHKKNSPKNTKQSPKKALPATIKGILDLNSKGVGFVPMENSVEDIEIQNNLLRRAFDGDEVEVKLLPVKFGQRPQGEVTKIITQSKREFVGVIDVEKTVTYLIPDNRRVYRDIVITSPVKPEQNGFKALVKITKWTEDMKNPEGEIIEVFGKKGNHEAEIQSIIADKGFKSTFPKKVEIEAEEIEKREKPIPQDEIARRKDFRNTTTFTIDPVDAKDFDDAISFKDLGNDKYEIGVHIADVSHYVTPGTELDHEAKNRSFSVYLVDRTIPMLPEVLSNDLCSLNPREDKLAFSAVFEMNSKGKVLKRWFGKTIINSNKRFSYEDAQKVLDAKSGEFFIELDTLNKIAKILQAEKFKAGAIDFETEEVKFKLDENGKPLSVFKKQRLDTHKLVEEYMLLANREVAEYIGKKSGEEQLFIYRVHDLPNPEKLADLSVFVRALGFKMPHGSTANAKDITKLLADVEGKSQESLIKTAAIRSMAKAVYSTNNIGHFGLAFKHYTHFTSPIRRYADLLVHRLLQTYLLGKEPAQYELQNYSRIADNLTDKEIAAADAERSSIKYKQVEYMSDKIGKVFDGIITGVTEWGVYVEEAETKSEGMVSVREMSDDYYELHEKQYALIGRKTKKKFSLGDKVKVKVMKTDLDRKTIDYIFV